MWLRGREALLQYVNKCRNVQGAMKNKIFIYGEGGSRFNSWTVRGLALVILVLHECIWNAVSVVFPTFEDTGSLGSPRQVVYPPGFMVPPRVTASRFFPENREAELKATTFSSLLLFYIFLSFLFS